MSFEQDEQRNPFGMDEACTACPKLVHSRESIVHGYGDVTADFLFIVEAPTQAADVASHPTTEDPVVRVLEQMGLVGQDSDSGPELVNAYITHLTRCRHPDRSPTEAEITECSAFLSAEIRMINPEILVPVGTRVLRSLAPEYTTLSPEELIAEELHGEEVRGRGFELVPMVGRDRLDEDRMAAFVTKFEDLMGRDYRQTKGRRAR